jgi:ribonuclease HII
MGKKSQEDNRLNDMTAMESHVRQLGYRCIAGIDEAGRGPLAGPVVAAACVIPDGLIIEGVNDSKKLTPLERETLYHKIISLSEIDYGIGIVDSLRIDRINILQATFEAMRNAIASLKCKPDYLLVDGLHLPSSEIPGLPIVEGDGKSQSIAAASILAKVTRDRIMLQYHLQWPEYGFDAHKGYGTADHLQAINKNGPCPIHRMSFEPLKSLMGPEQLNFL